MIKKYNDWYKGLTSAKRLIVCFAFNWIYWLIGLIIGERYFFEEKISWKYLIFHATWMSTIMTLPFSWKEWKVIIKGRAV